MKSLQIFTIAAALCICISSCSTSRKSKITTLGPNTTNPSQGVIAASGDALTMGIPNGNSNGGSAISNQNASNIANAAISRASTGVMSSKNVDSLNDVNFVSRTALVEMADITRSKAILNTSTNKLIKDYAAMILNDHQRIQKELSVLSETKRVALPDSLKAGLQSIKSSANQISSGSTNTNNIDLEYIQTMIDDHQSAIKLFSDRAKSKDPEIKSFATKNLPILRKHLVAAQDLKKTLVPR